MIQIIDIKKYPLTNRFCQAFYKENSNSKSISLIFNKEYLVKINGHFRMNDKYKNNNYLKLLKSNSTDLQPPRHGFTLTRGERLKKQSLTLRKASYIPDKNVNFIRISGK